MCSIVSSNITYLSNSRACSAPVYIFHSFNARDTIETADGVNATGNFAS